MTSNQINKATIAVKHISRYSKIDALIKYFTFEAFRKPKYRIAILRLSGVIGRVGAGRSGMTLENLNDSIEAAFAKSNLTAVILAINSPGGSPVQSELIASRISTLSKEKNVPVYSFVEDVAASGGYWLACAGDEIFASTSSIIGSIGVISSGFGLQDAIKKMGIERRIYTQGKNKSILDPFVPSKKEDIEILNNIQKIIHQHFIDFVKSRRKGRITQNDEIVFNGEFWPGKTAEAFGLIDGIDDMYHFIKKKFGDDVKIDYIKPKESWFKKKFMSQINADEIVDSLYAKICQEEVNSKFRIY